MAGASTAENAETPFGNDAFYWYNVSPWADLGLAVPNWSNDPQSQNRNIRYLCGIMGRNTQAIMFHDDARQTTPPSINTLVRLHKLCIRARSIIAGRAVPENQFNMESAHANPAPESHIVFPVPYFRVRNTWLKDYCGLILTAMTEAMQHQENANSIEISVRFGAQIGQYIGRVYKLMCTELFNVPVAEVTPEFTLTDDHFIAYNPSEYFTSTEMIDTVPPIGWEPTEDDKRVITNGIAVPLLPKLSRWPSAVTANMPPAESLVAGGSFTTPNA